MLFSVNACVHGVASFSSLHGVGYVERVMSKQQLKVHDRTQDTSTPVRIHGLASWIHMAAAAVMINFLVRFQRYSAETHTHIQH